MPTLTASALTAFARSLFEANGVPADEAAVVAGSLVDANLCGHDSHGVIRVVQYLKFVADGAFKPGAPFEVVREAPSVLVVDGHFGLGQVQAYRLLDRLEAKARQTGVCAGTLRNCAHIGRLGEYAERAASKRLAFMAAVNSHGPVDGSGGRPSPRAIPRPSAA